MSENAPKKTSETILRELLTNTKYLKEFRFQDFGLSSLVPLTKSTIRLFYYLVKNATCITHDDKSRLYKVSPPLLDQDTKVCTDCPLNPVNHTSDHKTRCPLYPPTDLSHITRKVESDGIGYPIVEVTQHLKPGETVHLTQLLSNPKNAQWEGVWLGKQSRDAERLACLGKTNHPKVFQRKPNYPDLCGQCPLGGKKRNDIRIPLCPVYTTLSEDEP